VQFQTEALIGSQKGAKRQASRKQVLRHGVLSRISAFVEGNDTVWNFRLHNRFDFERVIVIH
jgi:hypothetical protein